MGQGRTRQGRTEQIGRAGAGKPSKGMCVHPKGKAFQDFKPAVTTLVLDGVLGLAGRDGEK